MRTRAIPVPSRLSAGDVEAGDDEIEAVRLAVVEASFRAVACMNLSAEKV